MQKSVESTSSDDDDVKAALLRNERDGSLARVLYEEYKLRFAQTLGKDFAPMAEPLANCCMGPK
jgi:hypothetical protein